MPIRHFKCLDVKPASLKCLPSGIISLPFNLPYCHVIFITRLTKSTDFVYFICTKKKENYNHLDHIMQVVMIVAIHARRKETWWITFCKIIWQSTRGLGNNHYYRLRVDKYGWKFFIEADGRNAVVWHLASLQTVLDFTLQLCFYDKTRYNCEAILLELSLIISRYASSEIICIYGWLQYDLAVLWKCFWYCYIS